MPAVALGNGQSVVQCTDGVKGSLCHTDPDMWHWDSSLTSASDTCSSTVFASGFGVVCEDDTMASHPDGVPCTPAPIMHTPAVDTYSSTVFIGGKRVARVGDTYNKDTPFNHVIMTGSATVFIGG